MRSRQSFLPPANLQASFIVKKNFLSDYSFIHLEKGEER